MTAANWRYRPELINRDHHPNCYRIPRMMTMDDRGSEQSGKLKEDLRQVSIDQLAELVTDSGVVVMDSPELSMEFQKRGFVTAEGGKDGKIVMQKGEYEAEESDLKRMQSLVVDAYAPYSPRAPRKTHPFAEELERHARVAAPQQIVMQSPSEPEFFRNVEDFITLESAEQEVYADVRLRAAYSRVVGKPYLELHLLLEEVQFGVTQSFNNPNSRGHFVYSVEIKVLPSEKWAHHCTQPSAKPDDMYNLQRHSTLGVSERLSKISLPELSDEEDDGNDGRGQAASLSAGESVKHRWFPAACDPKSTDKAVQWAWKMTAWDDGQPFDEENPTNCCSDAFPELPFRNPEVVRFRDLEEINEATWEVPIDAVKALHGRLDWSFEIKIYTVCLQQKKVLVGKDVVTYRKKADRVASKYKGKTSRSNALIIPSPL